MVSQPTAENPANFLVRRHNKNDLKVEAEGYYFEKESDFVSFYIGSYENRVASFRTSDLKNIVVEGQTK